MSSQAVRLAFRTAWPILVPTIPLVETINDAPTDMETEQQIWATFVFDVINRADVTMGTNPWTEETGVAMVALMGYSGVGDDLVGQAAATVMAAWKHWISADKMLWLSSVDGPRPPDLETVGDKYRLSVSLNYAYQTRGG
jgi:hypothetical protein